MTVYNFDDIGALFDGATTTFTLQVDGTDFVFPSDYNIDITVGGVSLIEDEDFTITQSFIIFNRAPLAGDLFKSELTTLTSFPSNFFSKSFHFISGTIRLCLQDLVIWFNGKFKLK